MNPDSDLELLFELAPVGLCLSRDRIIQRCNPTFGTMFGYDPAELAGSSMEVLYPSPNEFESIGAQGLAVMRQTGVYSDERISATATANCSGSTPRGVRCGAMSRLPARSGCLRTSRTGASSRAT